MWASAPYFFICNWANCGEKFASLNFTQKISLWMSFLRDCYDPIEFEWLSDEIVDDSLHNRMKWELALQEALDQLHFRVVNELL